MLIERTSEIEEKIKTLQPREKVVIENVIEFVEKIYKAGGEQAIRKLTIEQLSEGSKSTPKTVDANIHRVFNVSSKKFLVDLIAKRSNLFDDFTRTSNITENIKKVIKYVLDHKGSEEYCKSDFVFRKTGFVSANSLTTKFKKATRGVSFNDFVKAVKEGGDLSHVLPLVNCYEL